MNRGTDVVYSCHVCYSSELVVSCRCQWYSGAETCGQEYRALSYPIPSHPILSYPVMSLLTSLLTDTLATAYFTMCCQLGPRTESTRRVGIDTFWGEDTSPTIAVPSPREPHALALVPVAPIQKSFGSSERDWKPRKKYRFLVNFAPTYSLDINLLAMERCASIRSWQIYETNPDFFASPVMNAVRFVVVRPCYLNRNLLSGPKGN